MKKSLSRDIKIRDSIEYARHKKEIWYYLFDLKTESKDMR